MIDDIRSPRWPQNENPPPQPTKPEPAEPAFVPPEVVAEKDESIVDGDPPPQKQRKNRFKAFLLRIWPDSKRGRIIASVLIALIVIGGGGGVFALLNKKPAPIASAPAAKPKPPPPKPTTEPSRLTGITIPIELNQRPVTAIQIENSPDARPQAGLKDAGVVFEAIAEGGITRFSAVFQEAQPDYIGPVRSIRPYYIDLFLPFDASIVHAGGSGEGLAKIRDLGVKDIDHGANGGAFQRVSDRFAPHNLYTSMAALDTVSQQRGYKTSNFTGYLRKPEKPGQPVTAKSIDLPISSALYNVRYDYDAASNSYLRSMGGRPHTDHRSGTQMQPKVVVGLVMAYSKNGIYSVYQTSGAGEMFVFQDGQIQKGSWKKGGPRDQFEFLDATGKKLALNPGQTWITLLANPGQLAHAP